MGVKQECHAIVDYRGGKLSKVTLSDPTGTCVIDCRHGDSEPFISVDMFDGETTVAAYLPPDLAEQLKDRLVALFPPDSPPVDFPAAVDPVAAIEREGE